MSCNNTTQVPGVGGPLGAFPDAAPSPDCGCDTAKLQAAADNPKMVNVDGRQVEEHPLPDLIAMDKYILNKKALCHRSGWNAVSKSKAVPPSTIGDV